MWRHRLANALGLAAGAVLAFMMLFTSWTVVQREFFDNPILGVVDVMELALVICVFLAIPAVFLRDENITVDVIDKILPLAAVRWLKLCARTITLLLLCASMVQMVPAAMEKYGSGEVTMTLSIDRFIHWMPILFAFAASIVICIWLLIERPHRQNLHTQSPNTR